MTDLLDKGDLTYSDWAPADSSEFLTQCVPSIYDDPGFEGVSLLPRDVESRTPPNRILLEWARRHHSAPPRAWYEDTENPFSSQ